MLLSRLRSVAESRRLRRAEAAAWRPGQPMEDCLPLPAAADGWCGNEEPSLHDCMDDPVVRRCMESDHVSGGDLLSLCRMVGPRR